MSPRVSRGVEARCPGHDLRRRADGLRGDRGGDRGHRVRASAGARAQRLGADTQPLPGRPGDRPSGRGPAGRAAHHAPGQAGPRRTARARHPRRHQRRSAHSAAAAALRACSERMSSCCAMRCSTSVLRRRTACDASSIWRIFRATSCSALLELGAAPGGAPRAARAGRQGARPAVHESVAAHAGLVPERHGAPGRLFIRDHAGQPAPGRSKPATAW